MNLQDTIPETEIAEAQAAGACRAALDWLREQPRTYGELIKKRPEWAGWQANSLAHRGDYAQAESWAAASERPAYWRGWCAKAAAHRGERYPYPLTPCAP